MSWHFSRALVEEYSAASSSDGARSAPSSGNPTLQAYLSPDRMTAFSRLSRFGMTFAPLMDDLGEELLTWFRAGFPVRTSALQGGATDLTESGRDSGEKCGESLAKYDPDTSSWKTAQRSLFEDSTLSLGTWPRWGSIRNGELFPRQIPGHLTNAKGSGSWPTPTKSVGKHGFGVSKTGRGRYSPRIVKQVLEFGGTSVPAETMEWLMDWPIGWTDLKPLAMDRFLSWYERQSRCSDDLPRLSPPAVGPGEPVARDRADVSGSGTHGPTADEFV